ncbi:hypothetical protein [Metabacillus schmidteae]|uniref:hypothetical protein n=1 Tax=Metabacillus schmidteae TaxID=2730405 RepID=UPI00158B1772|nr:hypothetical protein [Metabacillus schmidteae]
MLIEDLNKEDNRTFRSNHEKSEWISYDEAMIKFKLSNHIIDHLIENGELGCHKKGNIQYISINDLLYINKLKKELEENYLTKNEVIAYFRNLGDMLPRPSAKLDELVETITRRFNIDKLVLNFYVKDCKSLEFYNKKDIVKFRSIVYSINELLKHTNYSNDSFRRIIRKNKTLNEAYIGKTYLLSNVVEEKFQWIFEQDKWTTKEVAIKSYGFYQKTIDLLIDKNLIETIEDHAGKLLIKHSTLKQIASYMDELKENYFTLKQISMFFTNIPSLFDTKRTELKRFLLENQVQLKINELPISRSKEFYLIEDVYKLKDKYYSIVDIQENFINANYDDLLTIIESNCELLDSLILKALLPKDVIHKHLHLFNEKYLKEFKQSHYTVFEVANSFYKGPIENFRSLLLANKTFNKQLINNKFLPKKIVNKFFNVNNDAVVLSDFLNKHNITSFMYKELIAKEENIDHYFIYPKIRCIEKHSFVELEKKIKKIKNDYKGYCSANMAKKMFEVENIDFSKIKRVKTTALIRAIICPKSEYLYSIKDLERNLTKDNRNSDTYIDYSLGFEAFNELLIVENITFSQTTLETEQYWLGYVELKLHSSNANQISFAELVRTYARCTKLLVDTIKINELKDITTNTLNTYMFNYNIAKTTRKKLIAFIKHYHNSLRIKNQITKFKIDKLLDPYKGPTTPKEKELYSYEEFNKVYDYANNIEHHKNKAIDDALQILSDQESDKPRYCYYASTWLYVLAHLNNAWRHHDIVNLIPRVDLSILGIKTLEDFRDLELSYELAQRLLLPLKTKKYKMTKNKMFNHFQCSDPIAISLATAAIICTFIANKLYPEVVSDKKQASTNLITFGNKRNLFNSDHNDSFFGDLNIKFENRKMNRTLLVIMYMVLVKKGKGSQALEVAKRLRGHFDFESTNIYLVIPNKELDFLVDTIFKRGSFGYIPNLLANVLLETDENNRAKRTEEIVAIKKGFGGLKGIEATSGFLHYILSEKSTVADMILKMGRKEASDLLFSLNANLMPSKEVNIQCIFSSQDCKKPGRENCQGCPFSIPNYYAILQIVKSMKRVVYEIVGSFDLAEQYPAERTKLANQFAMYMDALMDAYVEFGEVVFEFFEKSEDGTPFGLADLKELFDTVSGFSADGISVENYITFSQKHNINNVLEQFEPHH